MPPPPTIFLLRGLIRESAHSLDFPARLAAAIPGATVHGLDIPGAGKYFRDPSPTRIADMVRSLRRDYLEVCARPEEQGRLRVIFSLSLGGMITFDWLARHPGDFARAAIGNTSLRGFSPPWRRLRPGAYGTVLRGLATRDLREKERLILSLVSNSPEGRARALDPWTEIARRRPVSRANFARQIVAAATFRPPAAPPAVPVLLLNGRGDRLADPSCSEALARAWGLRLEVHPDAGHELMLDAPAWALERLAGWFAA